MIKVLENTEVGSVVTTVTAHDDDEGRCCLCCYSYRNTIIATFIIDYSLCSSRHFEIIAIVHHHHFIHTHPREPTPLQHIGTGHAAF